MKSFTFKKLLVLLAFYATFTGLKAQSVSDSFYLQMTHIFQHVDTTKVATGLLKDYGMDFADVINFDGIQVSDTNIVYSNIWNDLYTSLYTYRFTNAPVLISPDSVFNSQGSLAQAGNFVPLSLLFYQYNMYKDHAADNGLVTVSNGQIYDKYLNSVWQNPYSQNTLMAVTAGRDMFNQDSITFQLPGALKLTNYGNIQSIQGDFADGSGYRNITTNTSFTINYADTGQKIIQFKITLATGQIFTSRTGIWIYPSNANMNLSQTKKSSKTIEERGFLENNDVEIPGTSAHSGGELQIHYSAANLYTHNITNPLIIAEGFDPWQLASPNDPTQNVQFDDFWGSAQLGYYGSDLYNLLQNNYDIIYVDYNNGTDAIERNAALLTDVINWVNSHKTGAQQNVVMGISMGGLVARYALRTMELNSQPHQTRLFISLDAPMLGANVPIGLQALDTHLENAQIKIGPLFGTVAYITTAGRLVKALQVYSTPAAKEMLTYYVRQNVNNLIMDNSIHAQFTQTLNNLGYPQNCTNVAVSNGSQCASLVPGITPGSDYLKFSGHYNTTFLGSLLFPIGAAIAGTFTNYPQLLLGIIPGRNDLICNFNVKTTPSSGTVQAYYGKISFKKTILWLIPVNVTLTQAAFQSPSGILPLDSYPGGQYDANQVAGTVQQNFSGDFGSAFFQQVLNSLARRGVDEYYLQKSTFTFTPTPHVFDIGKGAVTLTNPDYLTKYTILNPPPAPKNIPFSNFITAFNDVSSDNNEVHTTIETRSGNWIAAELNSTNPLADCSFVCSGSINGDINVCGISNPYSIPNLPPDATIHWMASPGFVIINAPDATQTTLTKTGNGVITLTATITSTCGTATLNKTVSVGIPPVTITGPASICPCTCCNYYTATSIPGATYTWSISPESGNSVSGTGNQAEVIITSPCYLTVQATTPCGTSSATFHIFMKSAGQCSGGCSAPSFAIAPNPAQNTVTISLLNNSESKTAQTYKTSEKQLSSSIFGINLVRIYDASGNLVKQQKISNNNITQVQMDVSSLISGTYSVVISAGTLSETQKVIIQR